MPTLSPRLKIPTPLELGETPDIPATWAARAAILDKLVPIDEGVLASRPVSSSGTPGISGRQYITTDQAGGNRLDVDYGTGWFIAGPAQVDPAPSVAGSRTLGLGAQQAMPGNTNLAKVIFDEIDFYNPGCTTGENFGPFFCARSSSKQFGQIIINTTVSGGGASLTLWLLHGAFGGAETAVTMTGGSPNIVIPIVGVDYTVGPAATLNVTHGDKFSVVVIAATNVATISFSLVFSSIV